MTVNAHVVDINAAGEPIDLGEFEFMSPPGAGDQIVIPTASGSLSVLRVTFVEHDPVALPRRSDTLRPRLTAFTTTLGGVD